MAVFSKKKIIGMLLSWTCSVCGTEDLKEGQLSFDKLPMTEGEQQMIHQIIETLGTTSLFFLIPKYSVLKDLGNKVQHVHPLKFLTVVLTDPHLKECMFKMEESTLKWKGFLEGSGNTPGFLAKCERENARHNFAPHILEFCKTVHADPHEVGRLVENQEWEKLVRFLIHMNLSLDS